MQYDSFSFPLFYLSLPALCRFVLFVWSVSFAASDRLFPPTKGNSGTNESNKQNNNKPNSGHQRENIDGASKVHTHTALATRIVCMCIGRSQTFQDPPSSLTHTIFFSLLASLPFRL